MDTQQMEISGSSGDMNSIGPRDGQRIAVILLNWNGIRLLQEFLLQVVAATDSSISRIIVADNGSTDDSVGYVRANFGDSVSVLQFPENYGFAEGYNRAIAAAEGYEYVALLNTDAATARGWDRVLAEYMDSHPRCGACQPKLLSYRQKDMFEYAGACGGFLDRNGYPYCRGRIFGTCEQDRGQYDTTMEVQWATGACLFVRRGVYLEAGGLDRDFFAHMEEIDLCWRIRLAGYTIAAVPAATAYHLGGGSLPAENPRKTYLNFRNNLLMLHKNLPDAVRSRRLNIRRLLDTVAWAKYVASFDFANASAIWRAHRDFAKMRRKYTVHPDRNLLAESPESRVNILTQYYLRGRRTFGGLGIG